MTSIPDVPWMIEGGAKHTVQVARNVSFLAAGGTEGITLGADLEVRETAVPGSSVRVFPGTAAVLNRAAGAYEEMYVSRVGSETEVAIAPTDGISERSDLIVLRVENPYASGETWDDPADPTVGPYASLAVISDVSPGTNSVDDLGLSADHSMIALARVDIPISTATITQSMITDLRVMANAVNQRQSEVFTPTTLDTLTSSGYTTWPNEVNMLVDVPAWATHARIKAILAGVRLGASGSNGGSGWDVAGDLRFKVGDTNFSQPTTYKGESEDGRIRETLVAAAPKLKMPTADRGKRGVVLRIQGRKTSGSTSIEVNDASTVHVEVEFINDPESNV